MKSIGVWWTREWDLRRTVWIGHLEKNWRSERRACTWWGILRVEVILTRIRVILASRRLICHSGEEWKEVNGPLMVPNFSLSNTSYKKMEVTKVACGLFWSNWILSGILGRTCLMLVRFCYGLFIKFVVLKFFFFGFALPMKSVWLFTICGLFFTLAVFSCTIRFPIMNYWSFWLVFQLWADFQLSDFCWWRRVKLHLIIFSEFLRRSFGSLKCGKIYF